MFWGYGLQLAMAVFVLQWETGYKIVKFLGDEITIFINYAYDGAATVFGDPWLIFHPFSFMERYYQNHIKVLILKSPYIFQGMAVLVYMGGVLSILYYYGLTQKVAAKTAWLMQVTLDTTAIETLGVASNIFLNGVRIYLL